MGELTNIEWCDATLNLWWGCTKVSDGCKFCYAEQLSDQRYAKGAWGPKGKRLEVKSWRSTLNKISARARAEGRLKVFCQSMSDTFEGPETCGGVDSENWRLMEDLRCELWNEIERHPELDFLVLTKRPENIIPFWLTPDCSPSQGAHVTSYAGAIKLPRNVWLGTSVENQEQADKRIPELLKIPAAVRFLSCEPLLGPVDLSHLCLEDHGDGSSTWIQCLGDHAAEAKCSENGEAFVGLPSIHWVICGGESGKNARPMNPAWARSLCDQCVAAGVPFFFKQWGEFAPGFMNAPPEAQGLRRVGKKAAGRTLDGRTWNQFPEAPHA